MLINNAAYKKAADISETSKNSSGTFALLPYKFIYHAATVVYLVR
ncbi:hypothetical protein GPUN_1538 [Glaciecola punicea ACAM 611]|uniref:Uncharacterized protein n=1 Tax=Glaciecola punicea ACAM 611 TaxID=1121923 RepID=H5TBI1_9ALTE|nr:hypothetical protein GPUN_1538 [Glaciecola punicea ACAM 611]